MCMCARACAAGGRACRIVGFGGRKYSMQKMNRKSIANQQKMLRADRLIFCVRPPDLLHLTVFLGHCQQYSTARRYRVFNSPQIHSIQRPADAQHSTAHSYTVFNSPQLHSIQQPTDTQYSTAHSYTVFNSPQIHSIQQPADAICIRSTDTDAPVSARDHIRTRRFQHAPPAFGHVRNAEGGGPAGSTARRVRARAGACVLGVCARACARVRACLTRGTGRSV